MSTDSASSKIVLYGHATCPGVGPIKNMLKLSHIEFEYINIHQNAEAAAQVRTINNGFESVPTLVFPDGSTLTEPSAGLLKSRLEALGYKVSLLALITGNIWRIVFFGILAYALIRLFDVI